MSRKKLKFKKLLNEYRTLKYEQEYIAEVLKEEDHEFERFHKEYCSQNNIDLDALNQEHASRVEGVFSCARENRDKKTTGDDHSFDFKHIFRQIARHFHPDVIGADNPLQQEYEEIFKMASAAIDDGRWGDLFIIAEQHDLDLDNYGEINKSLEQDIKRLQKEITKQKTTFSWLLFSCEEDEECKANVVKMFLKRLFNI